jgi:hypothetical protein
MGDSESGVGSRANSAGREREKEKEKEAGRMLVS